MRKGSPYVRTFRRTFHSAVFFLAAAFPVAAAGHSATPPPKLPTTPFFPQPQHAGRAAVDKSGKQQLSRVPLYFEPNAGQADPSVRFLSRGGGFLTLLTGKDAWFVSGGLKQPLQLTFLNARDPKPAIAEQKLPGVSNYFRGKDPSKWRTNIPHFARVRFPEVYTGIDAVYYSGENRLEYDLVVAPGADPSVIELSWKGAERIRVDESGDLVLSTSAGDIRQHRPLVYQEIGGKRVAVAARYRNGEAGGFRFELAAWDRKLPLVIDPVIVYSTFLGGTQGEEVLGLTVDAGGPVYLAGYTKSADFPLYHPIQNTITSIFNDAFVTKLNVTGQVLVYSTFLGGENEDQATSVVADATGAAYITGFTGSFGFPVTNNAYQKNFSGVQDAFVSKLSPDGNVLTWSTYLGTSDTQEVGKAIGVDYAGYVTVAGQTNSTNFPTTPGAYKTTYGGSYDGFLTKFDPTGVTLTFSTYFGGALGIDTPNAMVIDPAGEIWIAGGTTSADFPTTPGAYSRTQSGLEDAFVLKFSQDGKRVLLSTLLGGAASDSAFALALEKEGRVVIAGQAGTGFPTTANAYSRTVQGAGDAFVARFNSTLSSLIASGLVGSPGIEFAKGVKTLPGGYLIIAGSAQTSNFPVTRDAFGYSGSAALPDGFLTVLEPLANNLRFSTVLGGVFWDVINGMAQDITGDVYVAGQTFSPDFPVTSDVFQTANKGQGDGFVTRVSDFGVHECVTDVTPTGTSYPAEGGGGGVGIGQGCTWFAFSSVPWINLTSAPLTVGAGSLNYTVSPNPSADPRTGTVYVAGNVVHLLQKGTSLAAPFADVPASDPFVDYVRIIKTNNITNGCALNMYCPNDSTTRGQMAVFIVRSLLGTDDFLFPAAPLFRDVPAGHPQFKWIQKLRQLGITTGCNLLDYCPDDSVTRGQMSVFLIRSKFGSTFESPATPYFTDVPSNNIFFQYIQKMKQLGVTTGCGGGQFCVNDTNTRGQMAAFLSRMYFTPW
ncbi:MAG: SBBP repeat-containing protein [Bryobacterales bacterium]|nr:SBBP repeat-containing protein [Bryobacterales bacterium]